jgi:hypothetical protein
MWRKIRVDLFIKEAEDIHHDQRPDAGVRPDGGLKGLRSTSRGKSGSVQAGA